MSKYHRGIGDKLCSRSFFITKMVGIPGGGNKNGTLRKWFREGGARVVLNGGVVLGVSCRDRTSVGEGYLGEDVLVSSKQQRQTLVRVWLDLHDRFLA